MDPDDHDPLFDRPPVVDHLGECPTWCRGRPHDNNSDYPGDQAHSSELVELRVDTADGVMELYAAAEIAWFPLSTLESKRLPYVSMWWQDYSQALEPGDLLAIADAVTAYAGQLRELSARLVEIRAENSPDQSNPDKAVWRSGCVNRDYFMTPFATPGPDHEVRGLLVEGLEPSPG